MPDIAMCNGHGCPINKMCYRFTAIPFEQWQSYFCDVPYKIETQSCEYFWANRINKENGQKRIRRKKTMRRK